MAKTNLLWAFGRALQVLGMGITLVGLLLSIEVGLIEKESLHSMAIEFRYLGVGGACFVIGLLLLRFSSRSS